MKKLKIAAQLYTVRDFTKDEAGIADTLKKVRMIGYRAVQLSALGSIAPQRLKKLLDDSGLTACATHTPLDRIISETDAVIAEHKLLAIEYVGLGYFYSDTLDGYKRLAERLAPAAERIAAAGLKFVYHNHHHEFIRMEGTRPIDVILSASNKIGNLADLYWLQAAGFNPAKYVLDHAEQIDVVHFKDMTLKPDKSQTYAEVFNGNMDYAGIYDACVAAGVKWAAVEQDVCPGDPFDSLKISYDNLFACGMID